MGAILLLLGCVWAAPSAAQVSVVYLVRHAERADDGTRDPPLSPAGLVRVQRLQEILADVPLTGVYSTDLQRTMQTASPFAGRAGVNIRHYAPNGLAELADSLRAASGVFLVSGHSNTTPELVRLLGGDPVGEIAESEYDRLYIVVLRDGHVVSSTLLHF